MVPRRAALEASDSVDSGALESDLGWMLGVAFRSYVKAADTALRNLPGGPRGYQVLTFAAQDGAANQGAIASQLGIDRTVFTYLIDDLEQLELVERRPDPTDRRSRLVVATDKGRALWVQCQEALAHVDTHVLGALEPGEAATFRGLLQRVACRAQVLDPIENLCEVVEQVQPAAASPTRSKGNARKR